MLKVCFYIGLLFILACNFEKQVEQNQAAKNEENIAAYSISGKPLIAPPPSESLIQKYTRYQEVYEKDTTNIDNLIWYGRFAAYKAEYNQAIDIYTKGINLSPSDPRLYRHRGHRYISIRQFDKAIEDLTYASHLIEGKANEVEPDGMPNAKNIPISTVHGNIWYHLGLAHYLKGEMDNALSGFLNCLNSGSNDDNIVSSTHWLYMIARKMGNESLANTHLQKVLPEMDIVENLAYHQLCLFYKGLITVEELQSNEGAQSSNDAILYGIANWYLYNDQPDKAKDIYTTILKSNSWSSFGYIAAEVDYLREFEKK